MTPPEVARVAREAAELLRELADSYQIETSRCGDCGWSTIEHPMLDAGHAPTCRLARVLGELEALGSEVGK